MLIATVDFETEMIVGNPVMNPPSPLASAEWPSAGVAVWLPGEEPWYSTITPDVHEYLRHLWSTHHLLFHNAPFDLRVAEEWLGLPWPAWDRIHDTMYLVFHYNPYGNLGLKPASEEILGLEPDEQLDLRNWILKNVPEATPKRWGAYISKAPLHLVEKYAIGDVVRTRQLYDHILSKEDLYAQPIRP